MFARYKTAIAEARAAREVWPAPRVRGPVIAMVLLLACAVCVGYWRGRPGNEARHFEEGGLVTALSSILLGTASGLSATAFYLSHRRTALGLFWLVAAFGFAFFALDELLEFHEKLGAKIAACYGAPAAFRNWNDVIVISYGGIALGVIVGFLPEILRVPNFAGLLATACGFYVIHTTIDSTCTRSVPSVIVEETMKLFSGGFFALSFFAAVVAFAGAADRAEVGG